MKKVLALLFVLSASVVADDYATLITKFSERVGEPTDSTAIFSQKQAWRWLVDGQDKVAALRGHVKRSTTVGYNDTTMYYDLPADLREIRGVMAKVNNERWKAIFNNPLFKYDSLTIQYFIEWHGVDSIHMYVKDPASALVSGDSLRVYYRGTPVTATDSVTFLDECGIPDDEEHWVIDEAVMMYLQNLRRYDIRGALWQQTRQDQGITTKEPTRE